MGLVGNANALPSWSCDDAERSEATGGAQVLKGGFCEVIGQIRLHGVAVMLHWLVGEALVGKDSHGERGQCINSICFLTVSSLRS